ncbi:MAG: hypothetical protein LAO51_07565 [Acidobacteriia bacterium]|nr:hypothetical protein [Terriglobia bacterium]
MAPTLPEIEDLIPHGGPTRLLQAIEEVLEDRLVCRALIPASNAFVSGGSAPAFIGLEVAAQAAAVAEALERFDAGRAVAPRIGYLVGVRDAVFSVDRLPIDRRLQVFVRLVERAGPLKVYGARVALEGETCVEATISTTIP